MDLTRQEIAELVEGERAVVRDDRFWAGTQLGDEEIFKRRTGKLAQTIDAVSDPLEAAGLGVIAQQLPREARLARLGGGEVTSLAFCDFVESMMVRHRSYMCN